MVAICLNSTNDGKIYWYKQSCLLLHKEKFFAVDRTNYLAELVLNQISTNNTAFTLSYPQIPFCPANYIMRLQPEYITILSLFHPYDDQTVDLYTGRSIAFYPMRKLPEDSENINHIAWRSRDFLTPNVKIIQNWMKKISRRRLEKKYEALAMGLHERLGFESPLFNIGNDLLWSSIMKLS